MGDEENPYGERYDVYECRSGDTPDGEHGEMLAECLANLLPAAGLSLDVSHERRRVRLVLTSPIVRGGLVYDLDGPEILAAVIGTLREIQVELYRDGMPTLAEFEAWFALPSAEDPDDEPDDDDDADV
jgi:hypothetical protein